MVFFGNAILVKVIRLYLTSKFCREFTRVFAHLRKNSQRYS
jgi:hypothetical protein